MSCDRRSAQAMPAGPPPTMTTSASICGRLDAFQEVCENEIIGLVPASTRG